MTQIREKLSREAFKRVWKSRRWNTAWAVASVAFIGAIVFVHTYTDLEISLGWTLVLFGLGQIGFIFMRDIVEYVEQFGKPKCPRCGKIIEEGRLLDHELPKHCGHCGLEIIGERPN